MKRVPSGISPVITIDRDIARSLQRQIYDSCRTAILEGRLRPGQRLPSSRVLASEIGVSRFPVLNAYAQLLAEGYVESRVGAGTVVSASLPEHFIPNGPARAKSSTSHSGPRPVANRCKLLPTAARFPWLSHFGAFRVGQVAFDKFPRQIWSSLIARRCRVANARSVHYGDLMGSPALRRAVANYLRTARSVRCDAAQVLIVNGSQQALEIAARVLLNPGDRVWVEEPCYPLARDVFTLNGCHLVPVPVDAEGLNVAAGIGKFKKARAAFVTPSHQFPLGVTMSASRRLQLVEWAQSAGAWIIEDDYDSEYRYESLPIASLQGLDPNARVIYIGTFSKVLFPGLRLGYIVIPPDLVDPFFTMRRTMDLGMPTFLQEVLADFLEEGHFARHIRRTRMVYAELRHLLVESLSKTFGEFFTLMGDEAGMHIAVMLPRGYRDDEIAEQASRHRLSLWPLSRMYVGEPRQGFILGFGGVTRREIPQAVRKLRDLLATQPAKVAD
jgi:GntR family transcriptional regulator / MocR family aminotransferase